MKEFIKIIKTLSSPDFIQSKITNFLGEGGQNTVYKGNLFKSKKGQRIFRKKHRPEETNPGSEFPLDKVLPHVLIQNFVLTNYTSSNIADYGKLLDGDLYKYHPKNDKETFQIFFTAMHGLSYLHQNGIFHGDIKAENIFYKKNKDGSVYAYIADLDSIQNIPNDGKTYNKHFPFSPVASQDPLRLFNKDFNLKQHDCYGLFLSFLEMVLPKNSRELKELLAAEDKLYDAFTEDKIPYQEAIFERDEAVDKAIDSIKNEDIKAVLNLLKNGELEQALYLPCFDETKFLIEKTHQNQEQKLKKYDSLKEKDLLGKYPLLKVYPRSIQLALSDAYEMLKKQEKGEALSEEEKIAWKENSKKILKHYKMEELAGIFKELQNQLDKNDKSSEETTKKSYRPSDLWDKLVIPKVIAGVGAGIWVGFIFGGPIGAAIGALAGYIAGLGINAIGRGIANLFKGKDSSDKQDCVDVDHIVIENPYSNDEFNPKDKNNAEIVINENDEIVINENDVEDLLDLEDEIVDNSKKIGMNTNNG